MSTDDIIEMPGRDASSANRLVSTRNLFWLHLFITMQVGIIFTTWDAFVHALLPFTLINLFVDTALRAPLFALLCLTMVSLLAGSAARTLHAYATRFGWWPRMLGGITLAMWIPVLAGEGIRLALVAPALASVPDRCHGQQSLLESLRAEKRGDGFKHPHAWRIQSGYVSLWSYRTLAFEPAGDWSGADMAIAQCNAPDDDVHAR